MDKLKTLEHMQRLQHIKRQQMENDERVPAAGLSIHNAMAPSDHRFDQGMKRRLSPIKEFNSANHLQQNRMKQILNH